MTQSQCIKVFTKDDGEFIHELRRAATDDMSKAMNPYHLALSDGLLYVTDRANQCVVVFEG